ncbi:hypothetical protein OPT61_g5808 [Boeremia exigua]|uniref:Uncharacterized protein n=1 Tax=Boeremia exigua TaxID=749465 RepID=A0ACC2I928_9PLEO|nr:hypothetical protein OPT61_g5808 [Boeremia exigua]
MSNPVSEASEAAKILLYIRESDESVAEEEVLQGHKTTSETKLKAREARRREVKNRQKKKAPRKNPPIIGLYGISGAGKSHLLKQLSRSPLAQHLDFVDGSTLIDRHFSLAEFTKLDSEEQDKKRAEVMSALVEERRKLNKGIVVSGHLLFWSDESREPREVGTDADWKAYTHMVYLQVDPSVVYMRRQNDNGRDRSVAPVKHLAAWQAKERALLRNMCYKKRIFFTTITEYAGAERHILGQLEMLLIDFLHNDEEANLAAVDSTLEDIVALHDRALHTMLVIDADKTLAPQDAGALFWKFMNKRNGMPEDGVDMILKPQGYSYESLRQVALLYEEVAESFDYMCNQVVARIALYPEMAALLARVALEPHTGAVIVTCGLRQVWETVLRISGLTHVKVIGSGTLANGYIVTDDIKGRIAANLKAKDLRVIVFGDSLVDVKMLEQTGEAYVVVGEKRDRSASMDSALSKLIEDGCSPRQILLPATVEPRLTEAQLPIAKLDERTLNEIFQRRFVHATNKTSAKLLMTAMRDANISGHDLRRALEEVGCYLANEYLGDILGLEPYSMAHVTGGSTEGYRFQSEKKILIVALMRGGEPMAFGVSRALKLASFVHSKEFCDIDPNHFDFKDTIILVDLVVNSGKSIMDYILPLRERCPKVKVVVVAGVVQAGAVDDIADGKFGQALRKDTDLTLVALRRSENKYTGKGSTDTGHRLFNTTYLP